MTNVALPPGTVLGNYKLLQPLGQGGFGITYVAWDNNLKRNVVLKENFPTGLCFRDEESGKIRVFKEDDFLLYQTTMASLAKEAQTLASLNHERIVRVYDVFESHGSIFYVMPWLKGGSLRERMNQVATQENRISPEQATEWLLMLLNGLEYLHNKGIYHRDIKPGNILFDERGLPVLIDFGAALNKPETTNTITQGEFSYAYASPEQIIGKGEIGPWTDFYALAAAWYELISGSPVEAADKRLMQDDTVPLAEMNLSAEWTKTLLLSIDKNLRTRPNERNHKATEWIQAIVQGINRKTTKNPFFLSWVGLSLLCLIIVTLSILSLFRESPEKPSTTELKQNAPPSQSINELEDAFYLKIRTYFKLDSLLERRPPFDKEIELFKSKYQTEIIQFKESVEKEILNCTSSEDALAYTEIFDRKFTDLEKKWSQQFEEISDRLRKEIIYPLSQFPNEICLTYPIASLEEKALLYSIEKRAYRECNDASKKYFAFTSKPPFLPDDIGLMSVKMRLIQLSSDLPPKGNNHYIEKTEVSTDNSRHINSKKNNGL